MIPHNRPCIGAAEIAAVVETLRSGQLAEGAQACALEAEFCRRLGVTAAFTCSSGSQALWLALRALGIDKGDEVLLPVSCCLEVSAVIEWLGARPVWCGTDDLGLLDLTSAQDALTPHTAAILFPYLYGHAKDIAPFVSLGVPWVEDFAQTSLPDRLYGDLGIFSFYATKPVCGGEGGMVVTSRPDLADKIASMKRYDLGGLLHLFPLSDLQAALIHVQLDRQREFVARRQAIATMYRAALSACQGVEPVYEGPIRFRFLIRVEGDVEGLIRAFAERGVEVRRVTDGTPLRWPTTTLYDTSPVPSSVTLRFLSLPCHPSMSDADVAQVVEVLGEVFG